MIKRDTPLIQPREVAKRIVREEAEGIALGIASISALIIFAVLTGQHRPTGILIVAHLSFWLAGIAFLQRFLPRSEPVRMGRIISGFLMSATIGLAAVLFVFAAVARGVPDHADFITAVSRAPSLLLATMLAVPAVVQARRYTAADYQTLRRSTSDAARRHEEALSVVFHELRRPLSALVLSSELAMDESVPEGERQELLLRVRRQAMRLNDYMEELLELARVQSGQLRISRHPVNLSQIASGVVSEFEAGPDLRHDLDLRLDVAPAWVLGDPARLKTVVRNLVGNAVKYSPEGATVTVRISGGGMHSVLEVEDEGPGIPEGYRGEIFEQFFRVPGAPRGGFGLGLYIVREYVEAHGGTVRLEDGRFRGSRFVVTLAAHLESALTTPLPLVGAESGATAGEPAGALRERTRRLSRRRK